MTGVFSIKYIVSYVDKNKIAKIVPIGKSKIAAILKIYFSLLLLEQKADCLDRKHRDDLYIKIAKMILIGKQKWPPKLPS